MKSFATYYSFADPLPGVVELGTDEVHVVRLNVEELRPFLRELHGMLSPDEQDRASLYRYPKDGDQFILVRGALRLMLGRYLSLHPQEIRFQKNTQGKPRVSEEQNAPDVQFNVSFSGTIAVFAFAREIALGIDVELQDRTLDFDQVKDRFLEKADSEFLQALPEPLRRDSFFALWTLREAAAKADGKGIFFSSPKTSTALDDCTAFSLFPGPGYAATLVMKRPCDRVIFWSWCSKAVGLFHGPKGWEQSPTWERKEKSHE